ncbi:MULTISPECIES: hypothetical protein [unclassified Pseudomonas]|uniref:hypothetical protein n=1 Tax=unclassified Pseudomonas TaxID=196821 RepID=UPI00111453C5|nr:MULTISPECIES: hypothetical protein [unclassified Pseudomonas]
MKDTEGGQLPGNLFIHSIADVPSSGLHAEAKNWQFCVVLKDVKNGEDANICSHYFYGVDR